jgi:hypothetical protein
LWEGKRGRIHMRRSQNKRKRSQGGCHQRICLIGSELEELPKLANGENKTLAETDHKLDLRRIRVVLFALGGQFVEAVERLDKRDFSVSVAGRGMAVHAAQAEIQEKLPLCWFVVDDVLEVVELW